MTMNSHPDIICKIESELDRNNINDFRNDFSRDHIEQKHEYEQEIDRLKKAHNEQISKLHNEIERYSSLLNQYRSEIDSMRTTVCIKEKEKQYHESSFIQDLITKNNQLFNENTKLKEDLSLLETKYRTAFNEIQDARKYLIKMLASSD